MGNLPAAGNGMYRTDSGTHRTAFAFLRIDKVLGKFAALVGRTTLFIDMCQVFVIEVIHGRKDRVRRGLSQSAESGILYNHGQVTQLIEVFDSSSARCNLLEYLMQPFVSNPARGAFAAGFFNGEIQIELSHRHHTIVFIHHNHTARPHHGTGRYQVVVVDRQVQMLFCKTSAGRASGLYGFKFLSVFYSPADTEYHLTKRRSHRDFNQTDVVYFSCQGKDLGSFTLLRSYTAEPSGSFQQDNGDIGVGLHIIYISRTTFISMFTGEWRFNCSFTA